MGYITGGMAALVIALAVALLIQTNRLEHTQDVHQTLIANIAVERKAAVVIKDKTELNFKKLLGDKDAEYAKVVADFDNTIKLMRNARKSADSSVVPAASNSESSTMPKGLICFDHAELTAAQSDSEAEVEELLIECGKTTNKYYCALDWIQTLPKDNNTLFDLEPKSQEK